jgi:hypothetical protein
MSLAVATSGNRWHMAGPRKRPKQAKTVATGCDQLPIGADGKEEVPRSTVRARDRTSRCSSSGDQPGQQTGSKRLKSASLNHAESIARGSKSRMNRAPSRPSSSIVVILELACHAGGRGFESRRSRRKHPAYRHLLLPVLAQSTAGSPTGHALVPHANPDAVRSA